MKWPFQVFAATLLLLTALASYGQESLLREIDSLNKELEKPSADSTRARTFVQLARNLNNTGQFKEAERASLQAIRFGRSGKSVAYQFKGHYTLGFALVQLKRYEEARKHLYTAINGLQGTEEHVTRGSCYMQLGRIAEYTNNLPESAKQFHLAFGEFIKAGNIANAANAGNSEAVAYTLSGDLEKGIRIREELHRKLDSCNCASDMKTINLYNLGVLLDNSKRKKEAVECWHRAFAIADSSGNALQIAHNAAALADEALNHGRIDSAEIYLTRAETALQSLPNRLDAHANVLLSLSRLYLKTNRKMKARETALLGLRFSQQLNSHDYLKLLHGQLAQVDSALGDFQSAYANFKRHVAYRDSLNNLSNARELGRVEAEFKAQKEIERQEAVQATERERSRWLLFGAVCGITVLLVVAVLLFRGRRKDQRVNAELRQLNDFISRQKTEIEMQNAEITSINAELHATLSEVNKQRRILEIQHDKIEDSIRYASRIQQAILPAPAQMAEFLPNHFVFYRPRDIVSGDFYWLSRQSDRTCFAVVDCTGHGVPGAFMSVLGSNLLHQIVDENAIYDPDVILSELDRRISMTLRQQFGTSASASAAMDGMDVVLVVLHDQDQSGRRLVEYAGADRPLWLLRDENLTVFRSAKYPCGGSQHVKKTFPVVQFETEPGDRLFLFSDGITDQFGGNSSHYSKLGSDRLKNFIIETSNLSPHEQGIAFENFFGQWMQSNKQIDDALLACLHL